MAEAYGNAMYNEAPKQLMLGSLGPVAEAFAGAGVTLGIRRAATAAFENNALLAKMTPEARAAAARAYEAIAARTSDNVNAEAGRLYNLERAKFLRGEVDRIAPTLPKFKLEKGL